MTKFKIIVLALLVMVYSARGQGTVKQQPPFIVKGFHLDLRIQVMTMDALKAFALKLSKDGINTLNSWSGRGLILLKNIRLSPTGMLTQKARWSRLLNIVMNWVLMLSLYSKASGTWNIFYGTTGIKTSAKTKKDFSQVCPLQTEQDKALFTDLYTELASTHTSKYLHIGGDETYLLGHDERCRLMVAKEGKSKLYVDYIKMLCDIVIKLGKTPVLWADIALKYPDAIKLLPKGTVFVDWNYGWDMNRFGNHQKLLESGYEIWGAPALRSSPDNYFLTRWEKHFKNIRDFVPEAAKMGYKGNCNDIMVNIRPVFPGF